MRPVGNLACGDSSHGRLWSTCSPAHTWSYVHLARCTPHRSQPRGGLTVRRTPQRSQPRDGLTVARAVTGGTSSAVSELPMPSRAPGHAGPLFLPQGRRPFLPQGRRPAARPLPVRFWASKKGGAGEARNPVHGLLSDSPTPHTKMSGGDLLSHTLPSAVPSAQSSLATGFGMEPGVSSTL